MDTSRRGPDRDQPLRHLRRQQVSQLLRRDPELAALAADLRERLAEYRIVLAKLPPMTEKEERDWIRQRNVRAGICRFARSHGPATHGTMCDECYERNIAGVRKHRARRKGVTPEATIAAR
jgi:hypothetical protein